MVCNNFEYAKIINYITQLTMSLHHPTMVNHEWSWRIQPVCLLRKDQTRLFHNVIECLTLPSRLSGLRMLPPFSVNWCKCQPLMASTSLHGALLCTLIYCKLLTALWSTLGRLMHPWLLVIRPAARTITAHWVVTHNPCNPWWRLPTQYMNSRSVELSIIWMISAPYVSLRD